MATEVVYDVWGRVVASGYRDGGTYPSTWTCTTYDTRGRTLTVTTPAYGTDTTARTVTSVYAVNGDPLTTSVTDPTGTNTNTVDLLGRTTTYTHTVAGITGASVTTTTGYDTLGRVSTVTSTASAGGSSTIGTTYLPDGRVASVTLDTVTLASIAYDPTTKDLATVTYPQVGGGMSIGAIVKNDAGAVVGVTRTIGGRTQTETLTRSRAGRITHTVATDSALGAAGTIDWTYSYDTAARLTTAVLAAAGTRPAVSLGYGYAASGGCGADPAAGANGSRVTATRQLGTGPITTTTSCTDTASRLTQVTGADAIPTSGLTYDVRGNATQVGIQRFTYDSANRVTSTTQSDIAPTTTLTYLRDSLGRVATRTATGADTGVTRYAYSSADDSPDLQLTPTGALGERYLSLPGGVLHTKRHAITTGTDTYACTNLHGDTTTTLTPDGTITTAGLIYEPFGQPLNPTTATIDLTSVPTTRNGTTTSDAWHGGAQRGYEHTGGLNQTLMGARTYLPALGIFTARDPIPSGNTTTYTYPQDPINASDLSGNCVEDLCIGEAAAAGSSQLPVLIAATALAMVISYKLNNRDDDYEPSGITSYSPSQLAHAQAAYLLYRSSERTYSTWFQPDVVVSISKVYAKPSRQSGKEKKNDVPSYARGERLRPHETLDQGVTRILKGAGQWPPKDKGPKSAWSKIRKYLSARK